MLCLEVQTLFHSLNSSLGLCISNFHTATLFFIAFRVFSSKLLVTLFLQNHKQNYLCRIKYGKNRYKKEYKIDMKIIIISALDRMEDTPEMARAMIKLQTRFHLYKFYSNEIHSPSTVSLSIRTDLYKIIIEFYMIDTESPHNVILERPWIHMMKAIPSSYH